MKKFWFANETDQFIEEISKWRLYYNKVVLTGGYFDFCHEGHVDLIENAASRGKMLIVAVNSDECAKNKKGYCLSPLKSRMRVLSAFQKVYFVVENPHSTMDKMIELIRPQIYFKDGNINKTTLVESEKDICEKLGVKIVYGGSAKLASSSDLFIRACRDFHSVKVSC